MDYIALATQISPSLSKEEDNQAREWSELLPHMLQLIYKRLPDLSDFVRFRAVCKNWYSEVPLSDSPPQLLWLLSHPAASDNHLQIYSLSHKKIQTISIPESFSKEFLGPSKKHIFASDQACTSLKLFNPLSGKELPLPSINLDWCFPICSSLSCTDYVVICGGKTESKTQMLALCRPGDDRWTVIRKALESCLMIYYRGMYFIYYPENRKTEAIEITSGLVVMTVPPPATKLNYLVESNEQLLGISCDLNLDQDNVCNIYRLDYGEKNCKWIHLSNIGNQILFLEGGQGISISANESLQSERNCIFYLGSHDFVKFDGVFTSYYVSKYDIEERRWERKPLPSIKKPGWFLPAYSN